MEIVEVFKKRRSIRKFKTTLISDQDIEEILRAASLAPTARNIQPWEFLVIKDKNTISEMARLATPNGSFISGAPVCIAIFCQDTKYYLEDGCAATTQALLAAASLGLGACWVAGDKKDYGSKIQNLLGVPTGYKLISLIPLGFADEAPLSKKRNIKEMIHREKF